MRVIIHIDMNCYFVSAERLVNKEIRNTPAIVASPGRRSVVTAASYEARELGIHAGMPVYKAMKLCPTLKSVDVNFELYINTAKKFFDFISENISKKIEVGSIDEAYVDITENIDGTKTVKELCESYIKLIKDNLNLPVSIGASFCKRLAKMASDFKKPEGVTVINKENVAEVIWPLDVGEVFGVGVKTKEKLNALNINTVKELIELKNETQLIPIFGKTYFTLVESLKGNVEDKIEEEYEQLKSIGNEITMEYSSDDFNTIVNNYLWMAENVSMRAIKRKLKGNVVGIVLRWDDAPAKQWTTITRQKKLDNPINDYKTIKKHIIELFADNWDEKPIRKVGVFLTDLKSEFHEYVQPSLFDDEIKTTHSIIDNINSKYNKQVIMTGSKLKHLNSNKTQNRYVESDRIITKRPPIKK